jgi:NitT/TauT family transport system substrate-binding protein
MKRAGMISPATDVDELAKRAFAHLEGVSDDWLKTLQVEQVAGGQLPPDQDARLHAELARTPKEVWCGMACCNLPAK